MTAFEGTEERRRGGLFHPPASAYRVLHARRRRPGAGCDRGRGRRRPEGHRHHRPRQHVRRPRLLQGRQRRRPSSPSSAPRPTWRPSPGSSARPAGPDGRRRGGRGRGGEALLPPDPAGRDHRRLPQPDEALQRRLPGGLLLQASGRLGAAGAAPRGCHRHHRLPGRPGPAVPAPGRLRGGLRSRRPAAGHLRAGQPVRGAPGPRPGEAAQDQSAADRHRPPAATPRCWPPTTATTPTARTPSPTTPSCACRPARPWTTRSGSSSRATSTT